MKSLILIVFMSIKNNKKYWIMVLLGCYSLTTNVQAQVNESDNFVYLYSDSVLYAKDIRVRTTFFNSLKLRADSKPIALKQIKFYKNDEGFFANTGKGKDAFAVRIIKGKINIFEERTHRSYNYLFENQPYMHRNRHAVDVRMFYNKGYHDLKKVNYKNLKLDMADDAQSLNLLEGYRKSTKTSTALYVASGVTVAAAIVSFMVSGKSQHKNRFDNRQLGQEFPNMDRVSKQNFALSIALFGVGSGFAVGGYAVNRKGLRKLESTVDSYNR